MRSVSTGKRRRQKSMAVGGGRKVDCPSPPRVKHFKAKDVEIGVKVPKRFVAKTTASSLRNLFLPLFRAASSISVFDSSPQVLGLVSLLLLLFVSRFPFLPSLSLSTHQSSRCASFPIVFERFDKIDCLRLRDRTASRRFLSQVKRSFSLE